MAGELDTSTHGTVSAVIELHSDGSSVWGEASIEKTSNYRTLGSQAFVVSFAQTYNFSIVLSNDSVDFYNNDVILWQFFHNSEDGFSSAFSEIEFEDVSGYGTYNGRVDTVKLIYDTTKQAKPKAMPWINLPLSTP